MPDIPARVRATPPIHKGPGVTVWYQPANSRRDIPRIPGGQRFGAMDDFLLSSQLQDPIDELSDDMVEDAQQLAVSEGITGSGRYLSSFESEKGPVVEVNDGEYANPRVSAEVRNTAITAAAVEYGNKQVGRGHRILGRIAERYTSPKGGVES